MRVIHTDLDGLVRIDHLEQERDMALEKLCNLVEACSNLERFGVGRIGCDIDRGSRWAPSHRFSDLFNKLLAALKAAKEGM